MATKLGSRKLLRSTPQTHSLISSVREFLPLAACTPLVLPPSSDHTLSTPEGDKNRAPPSPSWLAARFPAASSGCVRLGMGEEGGGGRACMSPRVSCSGAIGASPLSPPIFLVKVTFQEQVHFFCAGVPSRTKSCEASR